MKKLFLSIIMAVALLFSGTVITSNAANVQLKSIAFEVENKAVASISMSAYLTALGKKFDKANISKIKYLQLTTDKYYSFSSYLSAISQIPANTPKASKLSATLSYLDTKSKASTITAQDVLKGTVNDTGLVISNEVPAVKEFKVVDIK